MGIAQTHSGQPTCRRSLALGMRDFVAAGAVAKRKVACAQMRFAAILPADAFALEHQLQEEKRVRGARNVRARVAHELRVGIGLRQAHVANGAAHNGAVEGANVFGFGDQG